MKPLNLLLLVFLIVTPIVVADENECMAYLISAFVTNQYPNGTQLKAATGNQPNDYGNYYLCDQLHKEKVAQYCMAEIAYTASTNVYIGACVPINCTESDLTKLAPKIFQMLGYDADGDFICHKKNDFNAGFYIVSVLSCLILLFVFIGTGVDYYFIQSKIKPTKIAQQLPKYVELQTDRPESSEKEGGKVNGIGQEEKEINSLSSSDMISDLSDSQKEKNPLMSNLQENSFKSYFAKNLEKKWYTIFFLQFSLIKNVTRLFTTQNTPLDIFNSIRVLSMFWVIFGHTFFTLVTKSGYINIDYLLNLPKSSNGQIIGGAEFGVDVFFFMSGFLAVYGWLKVITIKKKYPILISYLHRYIRLVPTLAYFMLVVIFITTFMGDGPLFSKYYDYQRSACGKYWWSTLLMINNWYPKHKVGMCYGVTWYLANDWQFFLIAPFIVILFAKKKILGYLTAIVLMLGSFLYSILIVHHYDLQVNIFQVSVNYWDWFYYKPMSRYPPYLIGMILCFYFFDKDKKFYLKKVKIGLIWRYVLYIISIVILILTIFGSKSAYTSTWNRAQNIFFITFSRSAFVVALVIFVTLWISGYGDPLKKIMKAKIWVVPARLTFCAYLIHIFIMDVYVYNRKQHFYLTRSTLLLLYCAYLLISYTLAFVFSLIIESPIMNFEKLLLKR
ncbi:o-acyltransferase [Anaeramoeba flamelloides]|uniref:O-acyltransferase n=1 Tax=Anaeramoeba flamelloides TaxID=1746091 RepID=A0ABQ8XUE1_9EUKA|nr:o-acyltransferase [Anaeramoeba flamelloides]